MIDRKAYRIAFDLHAKWEQPPMTEKEWETCIQDSCSAVNQGNSTPFINDLVSAVFHEIERQYQAKKGA